jgi:hypothetical protein
MRRGETSQAERDERQNRSAADSANREKPRDHKQQNSEHKQEH